jgi:hypothetical protein
MCVHHILRGLQLPVYVESRDKETKRQRDKETKRQRDKETKRQRDKETKRQRDKETKRQRKRERGKEKKDENEIKSPAQTSPHTYFNTKYNHL